MTTPSTDLVAAHVLVALTRRRTGAFRFLADLERLVNIDCGSYTKAGVDAVGAGPASACDPSARQ